MKQCSHCKRGEVKREADWLVTGYNGSPIKANVCSDHLEILMEDGAEIKACKPLTKEAWKSMERKLWDEYSLEKSLHGFTEKAIRLHNRYCHAQDMAGYNG